VIVKQSKGRALLLMELHLTAVGRHLPYGITLSVTCHLTQVNTPCLNLSQRPVLELPPPEGWKAEFIQVTGYIPRWFTCP